ncbi:MAG: hypothetical protein LHW56_01530 [Candidatus Cloacimonetes bacterium]|nr:hypothetical protein [Candidatus Cloacimonadota bacterium]MDY0171568.1 hypothetical protein [Candidatus Cloacimonadaceae bacterium]
MIKIVELGCDVPETGEARVSLLGNGSLIKTASNDIQKQWETLKKEEGKAYLHVIAMTDSEKYGPNNNGDFFYGDDLRKYHPTFVSNAHFYLHHVNKDPKKSIGRPIFSFYNEPMSRVELIIEIDKTNPMAMGVVEKIKKGEAIYVSMGVKVSHDVCSICGNKAKTRAEYCSHLRYNMRKILPDGRQVYAINPAPLHFFDISDVNRPADRVAWALQKAASQGSSFFVEGSMKTSAELGEDFELQEACLQGLTKLSQMIKQVEGEGIQGDLGDGKLKALHKLKETSKAELEYPVLGGKELEALQLSPGGILRSILGNGVAPSLSELAYASGRHHLGEDFSAEHIPLMLRLLPAILPLLMQHPRTLMPRALSIFGDYQGELDTPEVVVRVTKIIQPVARRRALIIKQACTSKEYAKLASDVYQALQSTHFRAAPGSQVEGATAFLRSKSERGWSSVGRPMNETFRVQDQNGHELVASRQGILAAQEAHGSAKMVTGLFGALAGLAALGAVTVEPSLFGKVVAPSALGFLAYKLLNGSPHPRVETAEGGEIPVSTVFSKTAVQQHNLAPLMGMSVPAALGLDYLYNRHLKYRQHPMPEAEMGRTRRALYKGGRFVTDNPVTSLAAGGIAGTLLSFGGRDFLKALRNLKK